MKRVMMKVLGFVVIISSLSAFGQTKADEKRMEQDIEIAENILGTLIRQQFSKRMFLPIEVSGNYTPGYGVTFRLPQSGGFNVFMMAPPDMENFGPGTVTYSYSRSGDTEEMQRDQLREEKRQLEREARGKARVQATTPRASKADRDSLASNSDKILLQVGRDFLADYGDVLSQLKPEEKIVITNRSEGFEDGFGWRMNSFPGRESRRSMVSVEGKRDDIIQLRQGKISRDQFLSRLKVVDTETSDKLDPDLEVLSSMFSRLYREDLSKTYFTQGDVNYERLKDFGVIYYMKVYSSNEEGEERWSLPTVAMRDVSQTERDKKVKEMYPAFESELKENVIEYGRTLRSLKDDEQLVFNIRLTKCTGCGIPSSVEVSVKNTVLKDYGAGKISREAAVGKVSVKKVGNQ